LNLLPASAFRQGLPSVRFMGGKAHPSISRVEGAFVGSACRRWLSTILR